MRKLPSNKSIIINCFKFLKGVEDSLRHFFIPMRTYLFIPLLMTLFSCQSKDEPVKEDILPSHPPHFADFPYIEYNPTSVKGIELGRKLFFDPYLSANNKISCGTCHQQHLAFTDGVKFSNAGLSGVFLHRNTPPLINLAWANNGLFWDGGSTNLESLSIGPITHLDEMGQNILELPEKLKKRDNYKQFFDEAFPNEKNEGITTQKTLKAIAQYVRSLVSANSKYDQYILGKASFTEREKLGLQIFDTKCSSCHSRKDHLFTDNEYHNIGLDEIFTAENERAEQGRYRITFKPEDMGKFRTPTLRNISYTAPYMHDGRFTTMNEVLDHFQNGIKFTATTSPILKALTLSNEEKELLKEFLKTLDDPGFTMTKQ